jgi:hypothetical protein
MPMAAPLSMRTSVPARESRKLVKPAIGFSCHNQWPHFPANLGPGDISRPCGQSLRDRSRTHPYHHCCSESPWRGARVFWCLPSRSSCRNSYGDLRSSIQNAVGCCRCGLCHEEVLADNWSLISMGRRAGPETGAWAAHPRARGAAHGPRGQTAGGSQGRGG